MTVKNIKKPGWTAVEEQGQCAGEEERRKSGPVEAGQSGPIQRWLSLAEEGERKKGIWPGNKEMERRKKGTGEKDGREKSK